MKDSSFEVLTASSPKFTISIEMLFFFILRARRTRTCVDSSMGDAMNTIIRCFCNLFCRCLSANYHQHYTMIQKGWEGRKGRHLGDLYGRHEIWRSGDFDTMHGRKNLSQLLRRSNLHLRPIISPTRTL